MGDKINANESVVATRGARVHDVNQTWNSWVSSSDCDFQQLSTELERLAEALRQRSGSPEQIVEAGAIAEAQIEAKKNNGSGVLSALRRAGAWSLGVAKDIGVALVIKAFEKAAVPA
jgi:hypothetical protein